VSAAKLRSPKGANEPASPLPGRPPASPRASTARGPAAAAAMGTKEIQAEIASILETIEMQAVMVAALSREQQRIREAQEVMADNMMFLNKNMVFMNGNLSLMRERLEDLMVAQGISVRPADIGVGLLPSSQAPMPDRDGDEEDDGGSGGGGGRRNRRNDRGDDRNGNDDHRGSSSGGGDRNDVDGSGGSGAAAAPANGGDDDHDQELEEEPFVGGGGRNLSGGVCVSVDLSRMRNAEPLSPAPGSPDSARSLHSETSELNDDGDLGKHAAPPRAPAAQPPAADPIDDNDI